MRLFSSGNSEKTAPQPAASRVPQVQGGEVAALYRAARVGGDFYDFCLPAPGKVVFVLLDIAGKREKALKIAAVVQQFFRERAEKLYADPSVEDADAITKLLLDMNRKVIEAAGGVICAPAFLACYDEAICTFTYINAGHTPGILKDEDGTLLLNANGLPLGLFSHATHDSQFCALRPGAAVLLVSKGLVESKSANQEFGIERVQQIMDKESFSSANEICSRILDAVQMHEKESSRFGPSLNIPGFRDHEPNDHTTLALMRYAERQAAPRSAAAAG